MFEWPRTTVGPQLRYPELKTVIERNDEALELALQDILAGTYGGIQYDGAPVPLTATTTPQRVTAFDTSGPGRGVLADPAADTLQPREPGVYVVSAQVTAAISSGTAYTLELYADGVQTNMQASVDASNQTTGLFVSLNGLRENVANAMLELRVSTGSGTGAFNVTNAEFSIVRVGL